MFGDWESMSRAFRVRAVGYAAIALAMSGLAPTAAEAGVALKADAKGGGGHLLSFQARYDAIESSAVDYLAGTLTATIGAGSAFDVYCVDLYDVIYVGGGGTTFQVDVLPIATLGPPGGHGAGVGYLYQTFASTAATDVDAAALQTAIWKVEYDNGGSLTSGHFTVADSTNLNSNQHKIFAGATAYLAAYDGSQTGQADWLKATTHPFDGRYTLYQNLVGPASTVVNDATVATPEPQTIAAAILGASIVVGVGLRRRIHARAASLRTA